MLCCMRAIRNWVPRGRAQRNEESRLLGDDENLGQDQANAGNGYIKKVVYGALDGVLTSFAVVAGVAGMKLAPSVIVLLGLSKLFGDGFSMGAGDYVSSKTEYNYAVQERKRELWECYNYLEGEKSEMIEIYQNRGMSLAEASELVDLFCQDMNRFVDIMMYEELGILNPDDNESVFKPTLVMFLAFVIFGALPLIPFAVVFMVMGDVGTGYYSAAFWSCSALSFLTMFALGAWTSVYSSGKWYVAGAAMMCVSVVAAAAAYGIGMFGNYLVGELDHRPNGLEFMWDSLSQS